MSVLSSAKTLINGERKSFESIVFRIAVAIDSSMSLANVDISKVMGFGSDGATAMTGKDKGCTGRLLLKNPMMINKKLLSVSHTINCFHSFVN
jgi:hypothetical protein